jgi:hypothetical protein
MIVKKLIDEFKPNIITVRAFIEGVELKDIKYKSLNIVIKIISQHNIN